MNCLHIIVQPLIIIAVCLSSWEGIVKPLIHFILLHLFGNKFLVKVSYGDYKNSISREYGIRAMSSDFAILKGLETFKNDWVQKSEKIPLSCVTKVEVKLLK